MAIEDILRALDDQAEADCQAVLEEARAHAKLITEEAQRESDMIHEGYNRQVERVAMAQAAKLVNAARLEAKLTTSSAKGRAVEDVFDKARAELAEMPSSPQYPELYAKLAAEAVAGLEGPVVLKVSPRDVALAERSAALRPDTTVEGDDSVNSGVVAEASGGRIVRRNTLEDRLERARLLIQADVAAVLFS
jgi:V/A-type H+-transporting ATPase subunit E